MRPSDTAITPERLNLLRRIRDAHAAGSTQAEPLYMDDLTVFARLRLVHFDQNGHLGLTERGRGVLSS
jgi:hypothetical protein